MLIPYIFKDFYYNKSSFCNKSQKNVTFKTSSNQGFTHFLTNPYAGTIDFVPFLTILQKFFLLLDN